MPISPTRLLIDGLALFIVVNPVSLIPVFLAITEGDPPAMRQRTVLTAAITASILLVLVALFGDRLLDLLNISVPAFQVAGGIILFAIGFEMLQLRPTRMKSTEEEVAVARDSQQVGVSPLGIPMLAGPGAITTVLVQRGQAGTDLVDVLALLLPVLSVGFLCWLILGAAVRLQALISPVWIGVLTRIEGLILTTIAAQMALDGIGVLLHPSTG